MKHLAKGFVCAAIFIAFLATFSEANMKKGRVSAGGFKGFEFFSSQDGPCTVSVIYDSVSADLDTAIGLGSTGDLVCAGISAQDNFDSCTAGLPDGDYIFIVSSFRGSSPFRTVVNCGSQEFLSSVGNGGIREIDVRTHEGAKRAIDRLKTLQRSKIR